MPDKKLKDFFDAVKKEESENPPDLTGQRRKLTRRIFLNKYFLFIVLILLAVICVLSQGIQF